MNQYKLLTESHGGVAQNNLSTILHLDEDVDEETEAYINFKLSEYYDVAASNHIALVTKTV